MLARVAVGAVMAALVLPPDCLIERSVARLAEIQSGRGSSRAIQLMAGWGLI
jgi:hypothetical protein